MNLVALLDDLPVVVNHELTLPAAVSRGAGAERTTSACERCAWCAVMVLSPSCGSPAPAVPVLEAKRPPVAQPLPVHEQTAEKMLAPPLVGLRNAESNATSHVARESETQPPPVCQTTTSLLEQRSEAQPPPVGLPAATSPPVLRPGPLPPPAGSSTTTSSLKKRSETQPPPAGLPAMGLPLVLPLREQS